MTGWFISASDHRSTKRTRDEGQTRVVVARCSRSMSQPQISP